MNAPSTSGSSRRAPLRTDETDLNSLELDHYQVSLSTYIYNKCHKKIVVTHLSPEEANKQIFKEFIEEHEKILREK